LALFRQKQPTTQAQAFVNTYQDIGIGFSGHAYWLAKNGWRYGDPEALAALNEWMEAFQYNLIQASINLVPKYGTCDMSLVDIDKIIPINRSTAIRSTNLDWDHIHQQLKYDKVGTISAGERKDIIAANKDTTWWQICCLSGEPIWIEARLVQHHGGTDDIPVVIVPPPVPTPTQMRTPTKKPTVPPPTPDRLMVVVTTDDLNVRVGPGTHFTSLGKVNTNDRYIITGRTQNDDWWRINFEGTEGWLSGGFVRATGPIEEIPVVATPTPPPVVCNRSADDPFAAVWNGGAKERIGCPLHPASVTDAAIEPFERGVMIWRKDVSRHYVVVNGGSWKDYPDTFREGDPQYSCPQLAPSQSPSTPVRGFGRVWCEHADVRQKLGNAVAAEWGERMSTQTFEHGLMIQTSRGIFVLFAGSDWELH